MIFPVPSVCTKLISCSSISCPTHPFSLITGLLFFLCRLQHTPVYVMILLIIMWEEAKKSVKSEK
jgi:hypothetical protein